MNTIKSNSKIGYKAKHLKLVSATDVATNFLHRFLSNCNLLWWNSSSASCDTVSWNPISVQSASTQF